MKAIFFAVLGLVLAAPTLAQQAEAEARPGAAQSCGADIAARQALNSPGKTDYPNNLYAALRTTERNLANLNATLGRACPAEQAARRDKDINAEIREAEALFDGAIKYVSEKGPKSAYAPIEKVSPRADERYSNPRATMIASLVGALERARLAIALRVDSASSQKDVAEAIAGLRSAKARYQSAREAFTRAAGAARRQGESAAPGKQ